MAHTFLSINLSLIKANTRSNIHAFGLLSNDGSHRLIDGYAINKDGSYILDSKGEKQLVTSAALNNWLKIPDHAQADISNILSSAEEMTADEYHIKRQDINSIYYQPEELL